MEHERRFVVPRPPARLAQYPHQRIRQGYLALPGIRDEPAVEVRVRQQEEQYTLTVKGGRGQSRTEVELPLSAEAFGDLWRITGGKRIEKVRYRIPLDDLTVELDVYRGKLRGLKTAEIEFDSEAPLRRFRPPVWLGREVTGRRAFANNRLAMAAKPPKVK